MTDGRDAWQAAYPQPPMRPSGLFPGPSRPVYREPHPVHAGPLLAGFGAAALWCGLFGGLGSDLATYAWWTLAATAVAWVAALILTLIGDRGVAVGTALASGLALSIAMGLVGAEWIATYNWPLW